MLAGRGPVKPAGSYRDSSCRNRQWKRGPVETDGQPKVDRGTLRLMGTGLEGGKFSLALGASISVDAGAVRAKR